MISRNKTDTIVTSFWLLLAESQRKAVNIVKLCVHGQLDNGLLTEKSQHLRTK